MPGPIETSVANLSRALFFSGRIGLNYGAEIIIKLQQVSARDAVRLLWSRSLKITVAPQEN